MNGNFFIQKGALSVAGQIMDSDFYLKETRRTKVNERNQATYENFSVLNNFCICIVSLSNDSGME